MEKKISFNDLDWKLKLIVTIGYVSLIETAILLIIGLLSYT